MTSPKIGWKITIAYEVLIKNKEVYLETKKSPDKNYQGFYYILNSTICYSLQLLLSLI